MVRHYKPKNKYCRRTKLSEECFLCIFYCYMAGDSATDAYNEIAQLSDEKMRCSRQAVEGIYLKLGKYLWEHFVLPKLKGKFTEYELHDECESAEHLVMYYLDMMRQAIEGEVDYKAYREDGIEIGSLETVTKLKERSQAFNGLPSKTFHYHFAYVHFVSTMEVEAESKGCSMEKVTIILVNQLRKEPL